jgi:NADH-quinone oxidoreductase subunit M
MHSSLWLTSLLIVPIAGALVASLVARREGRSYVVAVVTASVEMALTLVVMVLYNNHVANAQTFDFASRTVLAAPFGLAYDVALDGISLLMVALTSLVILLALLGARDRRRESSFVVWLLLLTSFTMGSFIAHDLLEFFVFFELTLIPCYFIISQWGGAERSRAALKFFVYTFVGSAFLFVGTLYLGFAHQHQTPGGALTFAYGALSSTAMTHGTAVWLFSAFAIAFAVKSPIWPLHTWSPLTYAEAPTAGSIEMSALLAKLGSYGLLRFAVGLFPLALPTMRPVLLTLAVIGILYGSALACVTPDLKRLVAYSSLAQMGFITLGIVTGSKIAMVGAVLLMFNHGVITAGFFLIIGFIERRRASATIADLKGLQGPAPVLAALFTIVMLASIGLPGLSGFVSEYLILIGAFATHAWWAVVGTLGVVLAALYLLWAYQRVFHGRVDAPNVDVTDANARERWVIAPIVLLIVVLGVFPKPVLDRITPSVQQLIEHVAPSGVNK